MNKIFLFLCFLQISGAYCQGVPASADSAEMYLSGVFVKYNPQKSFALFMQRAQAGEPKAMNAIGMCYTKGLGCDSNFNAALQWFRLAAISGYPKAWVNMGMLFKHRATDSLDFATANRYFDTALIQNVPSAHFAKGYMLYKGLGCTQNYVEALSHFRQGNVLNRADCLYFTGLCFKYGYGVEVNADSATFYINHAAVLGYKPANAERYFNLSSGDSVYVSRTSIEGESSVIQIRPRVAKQSSDTFKKVKATNGTIVLDGNYMGKVIQFDYSGKQVISEFPVKLSINTQGGRLSGTWQHGKMGPISIKAVQEGNSLLFSDQFYLKSTLKGRRKSVPVLFRSTLLEAQMQNDSVVLFGTIQMYNSLSREPEKPLNIRLVKTSYEGFPEEPSANVTIYPNPVTGNALSVRFTLLEEVPVSINIYDLKGIKVHSVTSSKLKLGVNTLNVYPKGLKPGFYVLYIRQGRNTESVTFINK